MIGHEHDLPITKQAEVLKVSRGSVYYLPCPVSSADLAIMRRLGRLHLGFPFAGSRILRGLLACRGVQGSVMDISGGSQRTATATLRQTTLARGSSSIWKTGVDRTQFSLAQRLPARWSGDARRLRGSSAPGCDRRALINAQCVGCEDPFDEHYGCAADARIEGASPNSFRRARSD